MNTERRNLVFDTMSDGVLLIRTGGVIDYINPSARVLLGVDEKIDTVTALLACLLSDTINDNFVDLMVKAIYEQGVLHQALVKYSHPTGMMGAAAPIKTLEVKVSYTGEKTGEPDVLLVITDVTQRVERESNCRDSAIIIACIMGMMFLYAFAFTFLTMFKTVREVETGFTWGCLLIGSVACAISYRFTSLSLRKSGFQLSNIKSAVKMSLVYIPIIVVCFFSLKCLLMLLAPSTVPADRPFFNWSRFVPPNITVRHMLYPASVFLQEFWARVFIHENIERIFAVYGKKKAGIAAVILSSLFFACVHLHQGFYYMMGAFALSVILGMIYYKTSNFWLVFLIHLIAGDIAVSLIN
ncbi:MAG: CPBP family glutamic-type intramembrane protease [Lachnospiraceae bacterium]